MSKRNMRDLDQQLEPGDYTEQRTPMKQSNKDFLGSVDGSQMSQIFNN